MPTGDGRRWSLARGASIVVGMEHHLDLAAARVQRFLETEPVIWLSSVRDDGTPHIVPVWFWWDGSTVLVASKPDAVKVRNVRSNPSVMVGIGDADEDFDIGLFEGRAVVVENATAAMLGARFFEKYRDRMAGIGLTLEAFVATYSTVIRILPVDYLEWHGRSMPQSARVAGAPTVSIDERPARRPGFAAWIGEPLAAGWRGLGVGRVRPARAGAL